MNATDREFFGSELRRGIAMSTLGDRSGTISLLRRLLGVVTGREDEVSPDGRFHCDKLNGELTHRACVDRQEENEKNLKRRRARADAAKTPSRWQIKRYRGKCPDYPACQTHLCPQGRAIRERIERDGKVNP